MQVLPSVIQATHVLDLLSEAQPTGFEALQSLASMPMALFDFTLLEKSVFVKMQPGLRAALLAGLLTAINTLRQLVTAHSLALSEVRGRPPLHGSGNTCAPSK